MNAIELLDIISTGETSKVQFKEELPHRDSVAQEIVAKSNSLGGDILLGVKDGSTQFRLGKIPCKAIQKVRASSGCRFWWGWLPPILETVAGIGVSTEGLPAPEL